MPEANIAFLFLKDLHIVFLGLLECLEIQKKGHESKIT